MPQPGRDARIQHGLAVDRFGIVDFKWGSLIMLQMMMGARVYETAKFKQAMDSRYYPLDSMKQSVAILENSQAIDIETMEFGQYQPILAPSEINPNGPKAWLKNVGFARLQLTAQPNTTPLSKDEPDVIPPDKVRSPGRLHSQVL
jgi:hypothetical protein